MDRLIQASPPEEHHSVEMWDFKGSNWQLSTAQYVSAPSSLRQTSSTSLQILCRVPATLCVPQGRIVTWVRVSAPYRHLLTFRHQSPLGSVVTDNCYYLSYYEYSWTYLYRLVAGHNVSIGRFSIGPILNTWNLLRLTWYNCYNPQNVPSLCVHLERWADPNWLDGGLLYDPENKWHDSEVNRMGLHGNSSDNYWDDTELWVPA